MGGWPLAQQQRGLTANINFNENTLVIIGWKNFASSLSSAIGHFGFHNGLPPFLLFCAPTAQKIMIHRGKNEFLRLRIWEAIWTSLDNKSNKQIRSFGNEVFPAMSVNKEVRHHQFQHPDTEKGEYLQDHAMWLSLYEVYRNLVMWKYRTLAPDSWDAYKRTDFSVSPDSVFLLYIVNNFFNLNIWFPLINSNLLMFSLPALCCKNFYVTCSSLCILRESDYLRSCLLGLKSLKIPTKLKYKSPLSGCDYFLSHTFHKNTLFEFLYYFNFYLWTRAKDTFLWL